LRRYVFWRVEVFILLEAEIQIAPRRLRQRNEQLRPKIQHGPHLLLQPPWANPQSKPLFRHGPRHPLLKGHAKGKIPENSPHPEPHRHHHQRKANQVGHI
jgi:hypothetical protein